MSLSWLTPEVILFASPHLRVRRRPDGALEVDSPDALLTYASGDAGLVDALLAAATRPKAASDLARLDDTEWSRFTALVAPALECGVLRDVSAFIAAATSAEQLTLYYALCDDWAHDVFVGDFWNTVLSGEASTRLVLGWCEQFYHRTVGADEHNEVAVRHCTLPDVAEPLVAHFREEAGHGEIFLEGLEAAGVKREAVASRPPLRSTRALVDFFSDLGRTDTLAYLACYGVLHSPREGQTLDAVRTQFQRLAVAYPQAAPALRRVGQHAEIDVAAGHDQIVFEPYLLGRGPLSPGEAVRVLQSVRGTVAVFNDFFDGILAAYVDPAESPNASSIVSRIE